MYVVAGLFEAADLAQTARRRDAVRKAAEPGGPGAVRPGPAPFKAGFRVMRNWACVSEKPKHSLVSVTMKSSQNPKRASRGTMTKRLKQPKQLTLAGPVGRFPSWSAIVAAIEAQPKGSKLALADYLNVSPSTVSEMLIPTAQPAYQRVISILQWLEERGVSL